MLNGVLEGLTVHFRTQSAVSRYLYLPALPEPSSDRFGQMNFLMYPKPIKISMYSGPSVVLIVVPRSRS